MERVGKLVNSRITNLARLLRAQASKLNMKKHKATFVLILTHNIQYTIPFVYEIK